MRVFIAVLGGLGVTYAAFAAALYLFQPGFIFHPDRSVDAERTPARLSLNYEPVRIPTQDGESLGAWFIPSSAPRGTVLFLQGSAGSMSGRLAWLPMFQNLGLNVLVVDYRGYGSSTGTPSESGTYADAQAAWRYLTKDRNLAPASVIIFGESLGGAVGAWLAARETPGALVLHSTFTSLPDLAADAYPMLPIRRMTRFQYNTIGYVRQSKVPVLVVHSRDDEVIRYDHAVRLSQAGNAARHMLTMSGGHNAGLVYSRPEWISEMGRFIRNNVPSYAAAADATLAAGNVDAMSGNRPAVSPLH